MKKILVVDDNTSIVRTIKKILEKDGHTVDTAYDGPEGIALIDKNPYDLVISDMIMPEIDGRDLAQHLKDKNSTAKLIIMTGGGTLLTKGMASELAKQSTSHVLLKPFDGETLKEKIQDVFSA